MNLKNILLFLLLSSISHPLFAQDSTDGSGKFSGLMYSDIYYIVKNHNPEIKDQRGIWFRRIYFTYDYTFNKNFSTRLRLEMNNEGDFKSKSEVIPFVKDAWLKYKIHSAQFILGIQPTVTFAVVEKIWGYRSVEKTPLDLQRMASSRDFGIAAKGKFDKQGFIKYHLMISNGSSVRQEIDKGKSGMLSLGIYPNKNFVFEAYGEYSDNEGTDNAYTLQGFAGYSSAKIRFGLQYADQTIENSSEENTKKRIASAFIIGKISERITLILRTDKMFDPNPSGEKIAFIPFDSTAKSTFILAGVDWNPIKNVSIIPNFEFVTYSKNDEGVTPGNDLIARITFFWKFE